MVLGNPGDERSGRRLVFRAVIHLHGNCYQKVLKYRWLVQVTNGSLYGEQIDVSHRQEHVKTGANYVSLQWLVERCWEFHTPTALDAVTVTWFSG